MGGLNGEKELLQSVALRVENIEGRGEYKVSSPSTCWVILIHPLTVCERQGSVLTHSDRLIDR